MRQAFSLVLISVLLLPPLVWGWWSIQATEGPTFCRAKGNSCCCFLVCSRSEKRAQSSSQACHKGRDSRSLMVAACGADDDMASGTALKPALIPDPVQVNPPTRSSDLTMETWLEEDQPASPQEPPPQVA